jgi:DNA-binding response OmpR family regulator
LQEQAEIRGARVARHFAVSTAVAPAVLVVEHDSVLREILERVLHRAGFAPVTVPNGEEALTLLRDGVPVKVILLNLLDGRDFRSEQQRDPRLAQIPVIVTSAANQPWPAGLLADAVVAKPIDLDQLIAHVRALCGAAFI